MEISGSIIQSRLSRLNAARGSCTCPVTVAPKRYQDCKSVLFTDRFPNVKKEHLVDKVKIWDSVCTCVFILTAAAQNSSTWMTSCVQFKKIEG